MTDLDTDPARLHETFSLLGHDIRLEILLALLDRWHAAQTEPQRYSELMRAVGMEDSGKFNYHLDKLRGVYLRKTEDGYVPTAAATALRRAVLAHRPTERPERSTLAPGVDCPAGGESMVGEYERSFFTLRCPACEQTVAEFTYPLPMNALEGRTDAEVLRAVYDRARAHIGLARTGQCPDCAGTTTVEVRRDRLDDDEPPVAVDCDTCTWTVRTGFLLPLVTDTRVARALAEVGVDVDAYPWELPDPAATIAGSDPVQLDLTVPGAAGTATVSVDGALRVRSVTTAVEE